MHNGYMCNTHLMSVNPYFGGTLVQSARSNIAKTARTAREMAEVQREAFCAVAENFAAAQRRSMGLAEGGLEFVRLQEQGAREQTEQNVRTAEAFARGV